MKEPKEKHELKFCKICQLGIDEEKEFVRVTHFKWRDAIISEGFYHVNCFRERISGGKELRILQDKANKILNFAVGKMGLEN